MAVNILDMVQSALGNQAIGQIGGLLGESEANTGNAVGAALPSILGGLMKQSASPDGAKQIFDMAGKADSGILGNIAGALSGGNHSSLIQTGMSLVGSIFGSQQSGLISTIARLAGIGQGSAGSLLGMLAPMVMGALSKTVSSQNLDAGGLASVLAAQKDHVASALPAELKSDLGLGGLLGQGADAVRSAGATATQNVQAATDTVTKSGSGMMGKLLPLIVLGVLAWLGWKFFGGSEPDMDAMKEKAGTAITDATKGAMPDVGAVTGKVTGAIGDVTTAVGGITDEASATAAVDKLKGASGALEGLSLDSLPGPAKTALGGTIGPLIEKLKGVLETAYAIPGVKGIVEPIVSPMLEKLTALTG